MLSVGSAPELHQDALHSSSVVETKKQRRQAIELGTRVARIILGIFLICDFGLTIALIVQPLSNDQTTFEESEDLQRAIIRMATSSVTAALSLVSLIILLPQFTWIITTKMIVILILRVISVIFLVAELAFPTPVRTALNATILCLILLELLCIIYALVKTSKISRHYYIKKERGAKVGHTLRSSSKDSESFVGLLDDWLFLMASRKMLYKKYLFGLNVVGTVAGLVVIVVVTIFVAEFAKIASTQKQLYSESTLNSMNSPSRVAYYNSSAMHHKVLVVVLDGLRYDYTEINEAFREFLASPQVQPHAKLYKVSAQLPSMSVPNWMTILTGAPPESTGVLGNLLTPETPFDTFFREASINNIPRGLTGSPWFSGIIKSTLPFLGGDGTIATTLGGAGESADIADDARAGVLKQALTELNYKLFLAHFSDIDIQGHCCGVEMEWNKQDSYMGAVTNKTKILTDMVNWIDNDTVVFMIADHGHVLRGGHGGIDPKLIEIPLIIYKKDSFFANLSYTGPRFEEYISQDTPHADRPQVYTNLDLAPTVSAILGIPVPRQNQGRFIDDAMVFVNNETAAELANVYYDLYMQKKDLVQAFIDTTAPTSPPKLPDLGPNEDLATYVDTIQDLIYTRDITLRDKAITVERARNIIVTLIIALMVAVLLCFLLQYATMCDVVAIFNSDAPGSYANRKACFFAFFSVVLYYGLSIAIYNICFVVVGYHNWDSTVIHTPEVLARYAFICLLPSVVVVYILIRAFHVHYTKKPEFVWEKASEVVNAWFLGREPKFTNLGIIYLYRYYLVFWTICAWLLLLVLQSNYTFVVSPVFQLKFINSYLWELRFRIITVQFMSLPLSLASFVLLFILWPKSGVKHSHFDEIYLLKIYKDIYRSSGASSITQEALTRLANSVYYIALWTEMESRKFYGIGQVDDLALMDFPNTNTNSNSTLTTDHNPNANDNNNGTMLVAESI